MQGDAGDELDVRRGDGLSRRSALRRIGGGGLAAASMTALGVGTHRALAQEANVDASTSTGDVIVPTTSRDDLPEAEASGVGRLRHLSDYDRSVWLQAEESWVSLRGEVFDVRAFGATGDGVTDDWGAFNFAIESMTTHLSEDTTSPYGRTLFVPPGTYRLAQSLVLDRSIRLVGAGAAGHNTDSILQFDLGIIGVIVLAAEAGRTGQPGRRGDGSIIERLRIESRAPGATEGTPVADDPKMPTVDADPASIHGIWVQARATVSDVCVMDFSGDGIHVSIDAGASGEVAVSRGTASWHVMSSWVARCGGSGLAVAGQGGHASGVTLSENGGWGIRDESAGGSTFVNCYAVNNAGGGFTSGARGNSSLFAGCIAEGAEQPRSVFGNSTMVVGGDFAPAYQGGNTWTARASRMLLQAQEPGSGETALPTAPTLHVRRSAGQTQPHFLVSERNGGRLVEVDVDGRLLVGAADLTPGVATGGEGASAQPVQVQISHRESGRAAIRWVAGEPAGWVAQARAFREAGGTDANPDAVGGSRLTFQTAAADAQELDTLTLANGRVGVGTTTPAGAAILDVASTTAGFLPPRMTSEQRDAIASPPEGLMLFNTTTKRLNVFDSEQWREVPFTEPVTGG